ncbi:uncharacterized protein L201_006815 [Kwoniella dendrophila CBS 6074]|uniref:C3H1-type domain-containing protein n=1 Tax=Kwoniella dendrophila CBS 6074 TaxID=1295534 RepID=A0AAX4K3X7_9TREE
MAPLTASEKQKILLQQEIAKLSGAISRHSSVPSSSYHPYRGRPAPRGYPSTRARGRGRGGRGGSYALDLRQINKQSSSAEPSRPSSSASIHSTIKHEEKEAGELDPSPPASDPPVAGPSGTTLSWVKGKGKSGNMSLMTAEKSAQLKTQRQKKSKIPPQIQVITSLATSSGDKRVVIDGVVFQFEQDGKKLTRIGEATPSSVDQHTPTRKSLSFGGEKYRRTSRGNLILKKNGSTSKSSQLCRYFTKTGRCNFGLTCPHIHDPNKVTICSRFLRGSCTLGSSCPLSHTPSTHNTPSCVRFQSTSTCSKPNCPYPHIKVSADAPVCDDFARIGWCGKEPGSCENLHVWECQEFREKGTCSKNGKCGLQHVVRAETRRPEVVEAEDIVQKQGEGGFDEQDNFIEFDQGSPGLISDGEGEDEEDSSEDISGEGSDSDDGAEEDESEADSEDDNGGSATSSSDEETGKHTRASSSSALPPSDMMDTDEVDEDAVLDVVF